MYELYGDRLPPLLLTTTASMVGVVTSLVLGVLAGVATFHAGGQPRFLALAAGLIAFAVSASLHLAAERRRWKRWQDRVAG